MDRTATRHKHAHTRGRAHHARHNSYDLYDDLEKIKSALADTGRDMRGKAGEMFNQSIGNIRDGSVKLHDNVADYAAEKPFKSLGFALLTGLVIGYFVRK